MSVVELIDVSKSFQSGFLGRKVRVLNGLSIHLEPGEVFGLLGHNGAGKTTTMRLMLGLIRPDSGTIRMFGEQGASRSVRSRLGFLGDELGLYPFLNAYETLEFIGRLYRLDKATIEQRSRELLDTVGLAERAGDRVKKYSKGMKQRLGIATAMLNEPELLILDEPYLGLDPIGRRQLRRLLLSLKQRGKTIVLSSHIVPDVEAVCDRVGILSDGHIKRCLTLKEIYATKSHRVEITVAGVERMMFDGTPGIERIYGNEEATVLRCGGRDLVKSVISKAYAYGGDVLEVKPLKFSLEDYLIEAMEEEPTLRVRGDKNVSEKEHYALSR